MKTTLAISNRPVRFAPTPMPTRATRAAPTIHPTSILVPVDFSNCSAKALVYAVPFAKKFGATITLLHVVSINYCAVSGEYTALDYAELYDEVREHGVRELAHLRETVGRETRVKTAIEAGHPGEIIVDTAKKSGADLIVIATHGRTGLRRAFLGSTAEYVVRHAPCPVLVVREHEKEFV